MLVLEPLVPVNGSLPPGVLAALTELYASTPPSTAPPATSPTPGPSPTSRSRAASAPELAHPAAEVLLARDSADGSLAGIAVTLAEHPDPLDPYPWIGLLMVHGGRHRSGLGRELAGLVEERLSARGRDGIRLAVLDANPARRRSGGGSATA